MAAIGKGCVGHRHHNVLPIAFGRRTGPGGRCGEACGAQMQPACRGGPGRLTTLATGYDLPVGAPHRARRPQEGDLVGWARTCCLRCFGRDCLIANFRGRPKAAADHRFVKEGVGGRNPDGIAGIDGKAFVEGVFKRAVFGCVRRGHDLTAVGFEIGADACDRRFKFGDRAFERGYVIFKDGSGTDLRG